VLRRAAPLLFLFSGAAGLILQVAWFRLLATSLGGALEATTAVLSAFMAGLALGAAVMARLAPRLARPLLAYGLLELGAGACALATIPLLSALDDLYAALAWRLEGNEPLLLALKLLLAGTCLVPSTVFMGGTLPALCQALARRPEAAGTSTGALYALNTLGAVVGTVLPLFWLMRSLGLVGCIVLGAAIDLAIAAIVLAASRSEASGASDTSSSPAPRLVGAPGRLRLFTMLLFGVGLAGLAYEVLWTRVLAFYLGSGAQAFGLVLAVVLAGLALGAFVGGFAADRTGRPVLVFAASQVLLAAAVLHQVWRFPDLPDFMYLLASRFERGLTFGSLALVLLLGVVQLVLPAAVAMGVALPAAVRAVMSDPGESGRVVGRLLAANTLGTIPGAAIAAWVLVPAVGVQGGLFAMAALGVVLATVAVAGCAPRGRGAAVAACGAVAAALVLLVGWRGPHPQRVLAGSGVFADDGGGRTLLRLDESPHGTVSLSRVTDSRGAWTSLSIDAVNVAGTSPPLLACQTLQGHLPLLLHAAPRSVLHVGFGSGGTAAAVATHASVEHLHVAEINPEVLRVSDEEMTRVNHGVLRDPRMTVHLADGRNLLLGTTRRFDCILSDSIHPRYRGNASLYTVEYFRLCRSRLEPGGLISTWLPIYSLSEDSLRSIVASMREVFPATSLWYLNSTVNEFVILIGRTDERPIDAVRMGEAFAVPSIATSLREVGVSSPEALLDYFVAEGADLDALVGDVPLHHDDRPWVELESATVVNRRASWLLNLRHVLAARSSVIPGLRGASPAMLSRLHTYEEATTHALRGHLQFLERLDRVPVEEFERARAINPEDAEPWEIWGVPPWVKGFVAAAPAAPPVHG
jgi:spermidine synthase